MAPLRILISNDDGVFADGIKALALAAAARGHQVTVVCPDQERSATGHGLTLQQPIRAEQADQPSGQPRVRQELLGVALLLLEAGEEVGQVCDRHIGIGGLGQL